MLSRAACGRLPSTTHPVVNPKPERRGMSMIFQSYALWPHMTVAENVAFGLEERKVPAPELKRRVAEALESVKMGHLADRKPNQLSGGQQQRVALARALVKPIARMVDSLLRNTSNLSLSTSPAVGLIRFQRPTTSPSPLPCSKV